MLLDWMEEVRFIILYVLGDVLDREPDGFRIMAARLNVIGLLGNHKQMAQSLSERLGEVLPSNLLGGPPPQQVLEMC